MTSPVAEIRSPSTVATTLPWRLLPVLRLHGAENMALDAAMAEQAREREHCILRIYGWRRATLTFGRNQRTAGHYDAAAARDRGIDIVRRPTGGRAVLHHREITYCVTAPEHALGTLRESYDAINAVLLAALRAMGVEASIAAPMARAPLPGPATCFEEPVAGEIVAGGRKLVGSAQWRGGGALLQHGSILMHDDQPMVAALRMQPAAPPPAPATLAALLGREPSLEEASVAFERTLRDGLGAAVAPQPLDNAMREAMRAQLAHFTDARWTWRR